MYCPNCGNQNPASASYCLNCGTPLGYRNAETFGNYNLPMSKSEYLKKYHSEHPGYYALIVLSIICDIIGAIIIISKVSNTKTFFGYMTSTSEKELFEAIIIGMIVWIAGSIFLIAAKAMDRSGAKEYEQYTLLSLQRRAPINSTPVSNNFWTCPDCGMKNTNAVKTCGNCGAKNINITYTTPVSANEWKCPKCGKINQNYVGTCGCGEVKPR